MMEKALPFIDESFTPLSDVRSSADGRKVMARNLLRKFWVDSLQQGSACDLPSNVV